MAVVEKLRQSLRLRQQLGRPERRLRAALEGNYQMRRPWGIFGRRPLVDGGHQDWGAFAINTGVDLTQENKLRELHRVGETEDMQPVQADVPSLLKSGFKLVVGAEFEAHPHGTRREGFEPPMPDEFLVMHEEHDRVYAEVAASHSSISIVSTAEDLLENVINKRDGIGIIKSVEGLYVTSDNYKEVIDELVRRNVRSVGPMWNFDNMVGSTTYAPRRAESDDTGLSDFGREVVRYLDERDIIVDLSHASDKTIKDVFEVLRFNPPVATHSGSREVHEHNRNLSIDDAYEIISRGGIVGIPFVDTFIGPKGASSVDRVVEHIGHLKYMGLLHGVVLGSDFNGMAGTSVIPGLEDITVVRRNLTRAMREAGFTRKEIDQVFYQNATDFWLRNLPSRKEREGGQVIFTAEK